MPSDAADVVGRDQKSVLSTWALAVLIVAAVAIVSYPNLQGFWGRDDFACIALVRMIGAPWQLFVTDHFFVVGSVFRPLGFFSEWLCIKLLGTDYAPNAAFDIGLHAAVALCLFRILCRPSIPPVVAALGTLLFAVHPATVGPSLWWSGRFDLQSTLFVLLAVIAAVRYRERATMLPFVCAMVASMAAMLSKENGLVAIAALTVVWGRWMFAVPAQRKRALIVIAASWLLAIFFFLWRRWVLGTFSSGFTGPVPVGQAMLHGLLNWARNVSGYLSFFPHLSTPQIVLIMVGCLAALASLGVIRFTARTRRDTMDIDTLLVGALLFVSPIVMQAPIAAFASPLSADMSAIEAGMQSRLYYLQTAGLMMVLATVIGPLYHAASRRVRIAVASSMALVAATFAWVSHDDAREFGERSFAIAAPARAAVAAIDTLSVPEHHCGIAFLGYTPPPEWDVFVSMDSIVKGLSTRDSIRACWIHSDMPTFFRIQPEQAQVADALPYQPEKRDGTIVPWRHVGEIAFAFLAAPDGKTVAESGLQFLIMSDGRFVDGTEDVRASRIPANLK